MKKINLLLFFVSIQILAVSQEPGATGMVPVASNSSGVSIRIRCTSAPTTNSPLFIIDGVVADTLALRDIDPDQIESISILKDARAQALYGCRASNGAVIIQLKPRMLYVKARNSYTGEVIPAVEMLIKIDKQENSKKLSANGIIELSACQSRTELEIAVSGYTASRHLIGKGTADTLSVLLEPVAQVLSEVIVKGVQDSRMCRYTISCGATGVSVCTLHSTGNRAKKGIIGMNSPSTVRLYPNPAPAGGRVTIQLPEAVDGKLAVNFYSLTGQLLKQVVDKSNTGLVSFSLPSAFSGAGVLLIQDDAKNVLVKEKVLVQ